MVWKGCEGVGEAVLMSLYFITYHYHIKILVRKKLRQVGEKSGNEEGKTEWCFAKKYISFIPATSEITGNPTVIWIDLWQRKMNNNKRGFVQKFILCYPGSC